MTQLMYYDKSYMILYIKLWQKIRILPKFDFWWLFDCVHFSLRNATNYAVNRKSILGRESAI